MTSEVTDRQVSTVGCWLGPAERPIAGWRSSPASGPTSVGVLIVPPLAYEYWTTHRSLRALAERLAAGGLTSLRIDLPGTGSSAGTPFDADQVSSWLAAVRIAVEQLRSWGCEWIAVVGVRFGATLALTASVDEGIDAAVAWLPAVSGRRHARELKLLGESAPVDSGDLRAGFSSGGVPFTEQTIREMSHLDLTTVTPEVDHLLLLGRSDEPVGGLEQLQRRYAEDIDAELRTAPGQDVMLDVPCERGGVADSAVQIVCEWLTTHAVVAHPVPRSPQPDAAAALPWGPGLVSERFIQMGPYDLAAVAGGPAAVRGSGATVVFLNCGAEHGVGSGRAWVEFARDLNQLGHETVRLDFRGWGESPVAPHGGSGAPYDNHTVDDAVAAVTSLQAAGPQRLILVGLCSSSRTAWQAALRTPVAGVFALNPQLYWRVGYPNNLSMSEGEAWLAGRLRRGRTLQRLGIWQLLDRLGWRSIAARWLAELTRRGVPVRLVFAEGDVGLRLLRQEVARGLGRLPERIVVDEVPGIDHQMHRWWLRPVISQRLADFVSASLAAADQPG